MATPDPDPKMPEDDAKDLTKEVAPDPLNTTEILNAIHNLVGNGDTMDGQSSETDDAGPSSPTQFPEQVDQVDEDLEREAIIRSLEQLEPELENLTEIAGMFHDLPLICMSESTDMALCYRLDPLSDILSEGDQGYVKDYRGMAEWIGLEDVFIKYLTRTESKWKTTDVLAKWSTLEVEPRPTLGNLQRCLCGEGGIDRPDVITDLAPTINKDAFKWKMEKYRANTTKPEVVDDSWQLTRQDVITGKRTYYTCCLIYADEDEGTASMITNLFKAVKKEAIFFNPQFDLKVGKYVQETTAQVIEERCAGRVIFVISEYFFASRVCQFTVQFAKGLDVAAEQGNLIPFKLTDKIDHVPRVLLGIAGIKWYRSLSRQNYWCSLASAIFGGRLKEDQLSVLQDRILSIVESQPDKYLCDPRYDKGTPEPGSPISVYDPPPDSDNADDPTAREFSPEESDNLMFQESDKPKSRFTRFQHFVRKKILRALGRQERERPEFLTPEMQEAFERIEQGRSSAHVRQNRDNVAQILTDEDLSCLSNKPVENCTKSDIGACNGNAESHTIRPVSECVAQERPEDREQFV